MKEHIITHYSGDQVAGITVIVAKNFSRRTLIKAWVNHAFKQKTFTDDDRTHSQLVGTDYEDGAMKGGLVL